MVNIWKRLTKPFFALAPMEDVTDTVFRTMVSSCARPDVYFTEFTNCDGLFSAGRDVVAHRLQYTPEEHPIVAQLWGSNPENYVKAAKLVSDLGFDGVDINMGCPIKDVVSHGSCAALIKNPTLATQIIQATKEGILESKRSIPVSVKTRIGFKTIVTEEWTRHLLAQDIDALTVHGRTADEMAKVPAHWDEITKVVTIRNQMKKDTVIIGNGDVVSYSDALEKIAVTGVDGVMIGRGIFNNMWVFEKSRDARVTPLDARLDLMRRHVELFDFTWGKTKNFAILKKFFKIYLSGFDGASDMRARFMGMQTIQEVLDSIETLRRSI
jgi:nifR3 family TIM-barrel protein